MQREDDELKKLWEEREQLFSKLSATQLRHNDVFVLTVVRIKEVEVEEGVEAGRRGHIHELGGGGGPRQGCYCQALGGDEG